MYEEEIYIEVLNNKVYLDQKCWACGGARLSKADKTWIDDNGVCSVCKGTRFELTTTGEAILDFIKRHVNKEK